MGIRGPHMRTLALLLLASVICLASGFYAGSAACRRAATASAPAALRRATAAMAVGRRDEALQYAFAAIDRDPKLPGAYEVAGDVVGAGKPAELARHFYRAALAARAPGAEARLRAKLAALGNEP